MNDPLAYHAQKRGKIGTQLLTPLTSKQELALAYTPGVAEPCKEIAKHPSLAYQYTLKGRTVAVITDGTAVLGLGDIGPLASLPVMEGKAALFKALAGLDAFPLPIAERDEEKFIDTVERVATSFGAINLEDIAAPQCFRIEQELKKRLNIPVFHDDQHGTAIVVYAALINALKLRRTPLDSVRIVVSGAGPAGVAITKFLLKQGAKDVVVLDSKGIISAERDLPEYKQELAKLTKQSQGTVQDALTKADVFIGVSRPGTITEQDVSLMNKDAVVFALANPVPEIYPDEARKGGATYIATGRSDFPNQINNVLVFPGLIKGAIHAAATDITHAMQVAAAEAIASSVTPSIKTLLPEALDKAIAEKVSFAVAAQARKDGVSRNA